MLSKIVTVGIAGPIGSGKSSVCRHLMNNNSKYLKSAGMYWARETASHSATLKRMLSAMGVPNAQLHGTQEEKAQSCPVLMGKSARHAMQTLGTEWGRKFIDPKVWLTCFNREVINIANWYDEKEAPYPLPGPNAYVGVLSDDVRFPNEVENIQEQEGLVFWLTGRSFNSDTDKHSSEQDLSKLPGVISIDNSGSLHETETQINTHIELHLATQLKEQNHA